MLPLVLAAGLTTSAGFASGYSCPCVVCFIFVMFGLLLVLGMGIGIPINRGGMAFPINNCIVVIAVETSAYVTDRCRQGRRKLR